MEEPEILRTAPVSFMDLPLDAIELIVVELTCQYWETAAQIQNRSRVDCRNSECENNPAFILSSSDREDVGNTVRRHFHAPETPLHTRNIKLATLHHIDHSIAAEASPYLWNPWVINLASTTRILRQEIFEERVMKMFYLQALDEEMVEEAQEIFGPERLAEIE